jgi:hypothetical protein
MLVQNTCRPYRMMNHAVRQSCPPSVKPFHVMVKAAYQYLFVLQVLTHSEQPVDSSPHWNTVPDLHWQEEALRSLACQYPNRNLWEDQSAKNTGGKSRDVFVMVGRREFVHTERCVYLCCQTDESLILIPILILSSVERTLL